jgi:hypothetical protein
MGRLRIVLACAALVTGLAVGAPVRADGADAAAEDLPWWAKPDYEEQADAIAAAAVEAEPEAALPEPVETPVDSTWWAGGPDAVLVLAGGEPPPDALQDEPSQGSAAEEEPAAEDDDGGRNPLFNRAEGHRAGEDPEGSAGGADLDADLEETERDDRGTNECRRLPSQIARYQDQLDAGGLSPLARKALEAQVERLQARLERRCPEAIPPSTLKRTVQTTVRVLARAAQIAAQVARYMYGSPF